MRNGIASPIIGTSLPPLVVNEREALCGTAALGASVRLDVEDGRLLLGARQRILLVELDGPRTRRLSIIVMGAPLEDQ